MNARARRVLRLWLPFVMIGALIYLTPTAAGFGAIAGPQFLGLILILSGASAVVLEAR